MRNGLSSSGRTVTVVADASFDEDALLAGWGGWIIDGDRIAPVSGIIRGVADSTGAELSALGQAIALAVTSLQLKRGDRILAISDCEHALKVLARLMHPIGREKDLDVRDMIEAMTRCRGISVRTLHTGRQSLEGPIKAFQHSSDQTARAVLAEQRARDVMNGRAA